MKYIILIIITFLCMGFPHDINAQGKVTRPHGTIQKKKRNNNNNQPNLQKDLSENISFPTGFHENHGYVDLGLPSGTKWATKNIGATSPSEYGYYFSWGETSPKKNYSTSVLDNQYLQKLPYGKKYDAAATNWGGSWIIPNREDYEELLIFCKFSYIVYRGTDGLKIVGPNGNSIFLPAGYCKYFEKDADTGDVGRYTTSTRYTFQFYSPKYYGGFRYCLNDDVAKWAGVPIRAVVHNL